ncbi:DUF5615 family PIN-like protein [Candidatus Nitrospira bockiana]
MPLKLVADLHISPKTVDALHKQGYFIARVADDLPPTATDLQIVELAKRLDASILTQDLDFSSLVAQAGTSFPSVLSLRVQNVSHQHRDGSFVGGPSYAKNAVGTRGAYLGR